jgi:chromosome partitioning related protein ParA
MKIAIVSTKGGVGKTTLAANLAGLLADMGLRVLMVDADIQTSLSKYYEIGELAPHGLTRMIRQGYISADCVSRTVWPNLDIVRSDLDLDTDEGDLEMWLKDQIAGSLRLRRILRAPYIAENYDVVVMDTQGALGGSGSLQSNAALAADVVLFPITPDSQAAAEFFDNTKKLVRNLQQAEEFNVSLGLLKGLIYRQERLTNDRLFAEELRTSYVQFSAKLMMLETVIPHAKAYKEASARRMPVHRHEPVRRGSSVSAWDVMHRLAYELFPDLKGIQAPRNTELAEASRAGGAK